jgi:predicted nucleotidyltransferase
MRAIPDELDPAVVGEVDARLRGAVRDHGVRIGWAVESGSRAWGFPSPDSDYDCRFLFVRSADDYLTPWLPRDVIETPLDAVLDVNGWDLRKAIDLVVRGNATVLEWLRSPIVYEGDAAFHAELLALAERVHEPELVRRHYAHLAQAQWTRLGGDGDVTAHVSLKTLLYALRPAATLHWLRVRATHAVPPMRLQELLAEAPPSDDVLAAVEALVEAKSRTRELGTGVVPEPIRRFIVEELGAPGLDGSGERRMSVDQARTVAAESFRRLVAG